jgi:LmbE family N-acetylglucosaminyl deacetylase
VRDIYKYQPQVLLTFHHKGVSGHPDHIAVAGYLEEAFGRAAGHATPPERLFGYGVTQRLADLYDRPNVIPLEAGEIDAVVDVPDGAMERKLEAIRRHETQYDFYMRQNAKFDYRAETRPEYFHLRRTRSSKPASNLTDLFEGIEP